MLKLIKNNIVHLPPKVRNLNDSQDYVTLCSFAKEYFIRFTFLSNIPIFYGDNMYTSYHYLFKSRCIHIKNINFVYDTKQQYKRIE